MTGEAVPIRIALVFGTLDQAGAEKQGFYAARALRESGAEVRVFSLAREGHFGESLRGLGLEPIWIGQHASPQLRLARLASALATWRPQVVQSTHFFTNLYAALGARICGALSIGALRNDVVHELDANPGWGRWLLTLPDLLVANSQAAVRNLEGLGHGRLRARVLKNVVDLEEFDRRAGASRRSPGAGFRVVAAGRMVGAKRFDRFLSALALAQPHIPGLEGLLVGDGPERTRLEATARDLSLSPPTLRFLGARDDFPAILAGADALALTSDHEGVPNVILEAMAAGLPVVATPAGGVEELVRNGVSGYIVGFDDGRELAERLRNLAADPALRRALGDAGRLRVVEEHGFAGLSGRLRALYADASDHRRGRRLRKALAA
jgi:glycosyltransferase involved in cell wall biosynthesis